MKYYIIITLLLIITIVICLGVSFYNCNSPAKEHSFFMTTKHKDDTLRIAYYGDSWAEMHKNHKCIIAQIISDQTNIPVKLLSHGLSGMTSKEIYDYMFLHKETHNYIKQGYNYIFISAGINDCNNKMHTEYYKTNMYNIIKFMIKNNIHPLILEVPDYNIIKAYKTLEIKKKMIRKLSMIINRTQIDCKQQFRDALDQLVTEKGLQEKISIIRYDSWNNNYFTDLKTLYNDDQIHLNQIGYQILDSIIAQDIIKHYQTSTQIAQNSTY